MKLIVEVASALALLSAGLLLLVGGTFWINVANRNDERDSFRHAARMTGVAFILIALGGAGQALLLMGFR